MVAILHKNTYKLFFRRFRKDLITRWRVVIVDLMKIIGKSELNTYNSGKVLGPVAGAYAELSGAFHVMIDLVASQLADKHLQFFDIDHGIFKAIFLQQVRRSLGLALHRGWAKLMLDRYRDLVQHPN